MSQYISEIKYKRTEDGIRDIYEITMTKPHTRYLDWFWTRKAVPLIHQLGVFPDCKEISESVAAYFAASRTLAMKVTDEKVLAICIGDGAMPRTSTLLALITKWRVLAIDPAMVTAMDKVDNILSQVSRLRALPYRIEDAPLAPGDFEGIKRVVLIHVHSHASLSVSVGRIREAGWPGEILIVSIPCCVPDDLNVCTHKNYQDAGILSPENQVNLYRIVPKPRPEP